MGFHNKRNGVQIPRNYQSVGRPAGRSVGRSVGRPVGRSVGRSVTVFEPNFNTNLAVIVRTYTHGSKCTVIVRTFYFLITSLQHLGCQGNQGITATATATTGEAIGGGGGGSISR
jgi:hypothetical protein